MGVEFQLDHQDHHKVEDFLARQSAGVGAITLHAKAAKYQASAAEAAIAAGLDVLYDPRTERLEYPGLTLNGLPGYTGEPYDLDRLVARADERQLLVDAVLTAHPDVVTIVTPPHFLVRDHRSAHLNLALAEAARLATNKRVRPVLTLKSRLNQELSHEIVKIYTEAGFTELDLRFTPLGSENDGIPKIRSAFATARLFRDAGVRVILGRSGNVGQAAFALGHVDGFSVGVGQMEHVDHAADVSRQNRPPTLNADGKKAGGTWQGVYLPGIAATVSMRRAKELLGHSDIRTRLGCRVDSCGASLFGPIDDYRTHYLHSRAGDVAALIETPEAWRPKLETDRLRRAIEMRDLVNAAYRKGSDPELKTRTLHSLVDGIQEDVRAAAA
ncbi:hypothetical protein PU630_17020 [Microbacterium horticulturae]|uniref:Uncharacterized protein n=1 Tax=Microbacterium horticulturae TaxID=3028316 RepID=A0ABY8BXJ1_9MICO|nr:hypothetical protein [Microbacterium sp. KACC 23027]WEG08919.1 hypothetical protein PU630_17020 [Microbacterium sp. KACC 23027]